MDAIVKRLKSKTYWCAIVGALLSAVEANSGLLSSLFPASARAYIVMMWPVLMIALREITTSALADK